MQLRQELDLYANLRPSRYPAEASPARFEDVDLIVVRENTEDLYAGLEHVVVPGVVESLKIITEKASTRIARFAFEYARKHGRKRVTAVHKANIMKLSDGLFLDCFRKVATEYPDIQADDRIVDNLLHAAGHEARAVRHPAAREPLRRHRLRPCGGPGGRARRGARRQHRRARRAVFEAVHGSAPDIAGQNLANPLALIRSGIMMLRHLEKFDVAERLRGALRHVIVERGIRTRDLGGAATTTEFTEHVVRAIER